MGAKRLPRPKSLRIPFLPGGVQPCPLRLAAASIWRPSGGSTMSIASSSLNCGKTGASTLEYHSCLEKNHSTIDSIANGI
jgi:hypothetical protein